MIYLDHSRYFDGGDIGVDGDEVSYCSAFDYHATYGALNHSYNHHTHSLDGVLQLVDICGGRIHNLPHLMKIQTQKRHRYNNGLHCTYDNNPSLPHYFDDMAHVCPFYYQGQGQSSL